ncbi:N-6 DNA methylase [Anaerolineales bacterium HSG24]|nr:N-6 DNA methylase [Anaerolineales bacterium HSG24]
MPTIEQLEEKLGYNKSSHYYSTETFPPHFETAHLFRTAKKIGVRGIYTFQTSPASQKNLLPPRPAVYVAEAKDEDHARQIHRGLWNLNYAPFLIIALPNQIKIYTGFDYAVQNTKNDKSDEVGLLHPLKKIDDVVLTKFNHESIDAGYIWHDYAEDINPKNRVDERLLANLDELGKVLIKHGLSNIVAHALIGKYVYLRYLRDCNVLDDEWLAEQGFHEDEIFSHHATVSALKKLIIALDAKINGTVFPIDFDDNSLEDKHVAWVAIIFSGGKFINKVSNLSDEIVQLHLQFQAYDFRYIPVETLSSIYEQFIQTDRKKIGAIYTPEVLADYLLAEIESVKSLEKGMTILDPACGSGIFLVLAYRRLIEKELAAQNRSKLSPAYLAEILEASIYGVERERDACYITEFSLILTLLHYAEPSALKNLNFKLPKLYGEQIFESDFFDMKSEFWKLRVNFDWVVGNPPWISAKGKREKHARDWIKNNQENYPVGDNSVAEAFSWLVTELLKENEGIVGLVMPANSLFKIREPTKKYRQHFFRDHIVWRITNFANLRAILFDGRTGYPAATFIYQKYHDNNLKPDIFHYGPFIVNQVSSVRKKPWVITVYENEIKELSPYKAENGDTVFWKVALWGSYLDEQTLRRIERLFPTTLRDLCKKQNWVFHRDIELRNWEEEKDKLIKKGFSSEKAEQKLQADLKHVPELQDKMIFQSKFIRPSLARFSISQGILKTISIEWCYIRKRGGESGLKVMPRPHLILSPIWMSYVIYSNDDFLMAPKHIGIAGPLKDTAYLKAISVYLNSSLVAYHLFFHAHEWGVFRQANWVSSTEVSGIRVPRLSNEQIEVLSRLQENIVKTERQEILNYISGLPKQLSFEDDDKIIDFRVQKHLSPKGKEQAQFVAITKYNQMVKVTKNESKSLKQFVTTDLRPKLQRLMDDTINRLFDIPDDVRLAVDDFIKYRVPLDRATIPQAVIQHPTRQELLAYATKMRDQLDGFIRGKAYHRVSITTTPKIIVCTIEITQEGDTIPITEDDINKANSIMSELLTGMSEALRQQVSQWVYVQRGLRLFDGPRIYLCKTPRIIEWTRTQAILDAGDIIGQLIKGDWDDE